MANRDSREVNTRDNTERKATWKPANALPDPDPQEGFVFLCKNSTENIDARREHHQQLTSNQMSAVDNNYLRESDPRMPVLRPEKSTRTS